MIDEQLAGRPRRDSAGGNCRPLSDRAAGQPIVRAERPGGRRVRAAGTGWSTLPPPGCSTATSSSGTAPRSTADELNEALTEASDVFVTDSNRDRARHWRSSQDTTGYTESDQPELGLLRDVASDATPAGVRRPRRARSIRRLRRSPARSARSRRRPRRTASRSPTCPSTGRTWRSTATPPLPGPSASTPTRSARRIAPALRASRCARSISCRPRRRASDGSPTCRSATPVRRR